MLNPELPFEEKMYVFVSCYLTFHVGHVDPKICGEP